MIKIPVIKTLRQSIILGRLVVLPMCALIVGRREFLMRLTLCAA